MSSPAPRLRAFRVDASRPLVPNDLMPRAHGGDVDVVLVQGLYADHEIQTLVDRLESSAVDLPAMDLPPGKAGRVLGHVLDLARPDLEGYFEDREAFEAGVPRLFEGIPEFESRIRTLFTALAGGRQVGRLTAGDGRTYLPYSFRNLKERGFVRIHCEDEKLKARAKSRILEVATPHVSSFYLTLAPARDGGELILYDLTWDQATEEHLVNGRPCPKKIPERVTGYSYAPRAGDMVIFGRGRIHEVRPVGPASSRWTVGGFYCLGLDDESLYYFS